MVIGDIEYFGSRRRAVQADRGDGDVENIIVPAIVDQNLSLGNDLKLTKYLVVGECEGGLLAFTPESCRYVTLDHLYDPGEELQSLVQLLRFTVGRIVPLR